LLRLLILLLVAACTLSWSC